MLKPTEPVNIGFFLIPGFALMSYASAIEPIRAANLISGQELYRWQNISLAGDDVACSANQDIACSNSINDTPKLDFLFVCAGGNPFAYKDRRLFSWLRELSVAGVSLGGVSGGSVILAKAKVVAGRRVTVHWEHVDAMREAFPDHAIEQSLYVIDRDRITCAGGVAPIDMMHALIAQQHGAPFAKKVSNWFLHTDIRPPGAAQRMGIADTYGVTNSALVHAIEFMQNHLGAPTQLSEIAEYAGVSDRQLSRLFKDEMGVSTARFFRTLRLNYAAKLLRQSTMNITEISYAAGFSSGAHFSKAFLAEFGSTPIKVRKARRPPQTQ